jgi:hypothetical protein
MRALWGPPPLPHRPLTSRFELSDKWDVDRLLLGLRAVAADARLTTSAFDVGLTTRWRTGRAGEAMPDAGGRSGAELESLVRSAATAALTAIGIPWVQLGSSSACPIACAGSSRTITGSRRSISARI